MAVVTARRTLSIAAAAVLMAIVAAASLAAASKDADALTSLRNGLKDPDGALKSWDPTLVNPCTWMSVTCDGDNRASPACKWRWRLAASFFQTSLSIWVRLGLGEKRDAFVIHLRPRSFRPEPPGMRPVPGGLVRKRSCSWG
ncbi:hypothetical protein SETIT_3G197900v2 [Setaria italica]|uniref:Leucine-rich repeat-containing N-terminal plant-type domain-containing protein n=2 Tax=Setaria TaxID=4554 RepID=A0A368QGQ5_SETIT|nr:hypothetical protein SETIT_3G197900v2 [Setaria italica]TKW26621.1 hypothetical protein SEVIR_3G202400v2 [Setaria viridis]